MKARTLLLIRHAKARRDESIRDADRSLSGRGRRDASKMARRLARIGVKPDLVLSSPARRARATARILARRLDYRRKDIVVDERIYAGDARALLRLIGACDDKLGTVVLCGHNPALRDLARHLSPQIVRLPTSAVATFVFNAAHWAQIGRFPPHRVTLDLPTLPAASAPDTCQASGF